jgi:hypothetical protein
MRQDERRRRAAALTGAIILLAAAAARALTPTPTPPLDPVATPSPTPTPQTPLRVVAAPNPARGGRRVTLSANMTLFGGAPRWAQIGGEVSVTLELADTLAATFVAPEVAQPTALQFRFSMPPLPDLRDLEVTILPTDTVAVAIAHVSGPPGGLVEAGVTVDPLGLSVGELHHQLGFAPEAAVADRGDGTPDCAPAAERAVQSASFVFLPPGCAATQSCDRVRADLVFAEPLAAAAEAYRCRIALTDEPADSCQHALACTGGDARADDGGALAIHCVEGSVTAQLTHVEPEFALRVEPAHPVVGETLRLIFSVAYVGFVPSYQLAGVWPLLEGSLVADLSRPGEVAYDLRALRAGTAYLQLGVYYEITGGCPGHMFFYFRSAASPVFALTISDPAGVRVAGRVAEFPAGCQGAMRGVDVVLQPGGRTARTDLAAGEFAFDGVSPGDYSLTVAQGCNPFGCWPARDIRVGSEDLFLTLCPRTLACVGDCDGDQRVTIAELVAGVGMALQSTLSPACAAFDADASGAVQIEELVSAVIAALYGCAGESETTPTPTPSARP